MDWGFDTRSVRLQDGSLHTLNQFHVGLVLAHRYATFAEAVAAAQAAGRGVLVDAAFTLSSNTTVAAAVPLFFTPPGVLTVASGVTLTINSTVRAGRHQIFAADETTTGSVRFSSRVLGPVSPEWWGAAGDDSTNDTLAVQAAINSLAAGGTVEGLERHTYRIARTTGTNDSWGVKITVSNITLKSCKFRRFNTDISTYANAYPIVFVGTPDSNVAAAVTDTVIEGCAFTGKTPGMPSQAPCHRISATLLPSIIPGARW